MSILKEITEILVGGLTEMATGIGTGLNSMVQSAFIVAGENGEKSLSTFGVVIAVFAGIALAVGLTTLVTKWIMSLGGRK